nr:MAG TPA: hypothetical protein [Caudoviricetes sp.]
MPSVPRPCGRGTSYGYIFGLVYFCHHDLCNHNACE